jgi:ADP-ribose pyrophosphatase
LSDSHTSPVQFETTIDSQRHFEGRIFSVRVDTVELPGGRRTIREVVEHSDAVCMVPVDDEGNVLLVRQFRKPTESSILEVPAGGVETGEVSEDTVIRELQEEVGYTADRITHLASFWVAPGWATERMHAYLATGLRPSKLSADDDENIEVVRLPFQQAVAMIQTGEIHDGKTIASLLMAGPFIEQG